MARRNVALATNGGVATADGDQGAPFLPSGAINGNRTTSGWGSNNGWAYGDFVAPLPHWLVVTFSGPMSIDEIDVITYGSASPTLSTPVDANYGVHDFVVEYYDGAAWQNVATVTGNAYVWRQFTFTAVTATKIRVTVSVAGSADQTARILEFEAWGDDAPTGQPATRRFGGIHHGPGRHGAPSGVRTF